MKLVGAVTEGSGAINEDGMGYLGNINSVTAAWVFDGVTGINGKNYLFAGTDAAWLVGQAHKHLLKLAACDIPLGEIIFRLVECLIADWRDASKNLHLPEYYDPPAACLILAKQYGKTWQAVRLGDSCLLARTEDGATIRLVASPNNAFDQWLATEVAKRRDAGMRDIKALLAEFQTDLAQGRKSRNTVDGYGILEANPSAVEFAEYVNLGSPNELLICTDGYYRAVDCYALHSDESLVFASLRPEGVNKITQDIRAIEATDRSCQTYQRFKPADDVTAIMLKKGKLHGKAT